MERLSTDCHPELGKVDRTRFHPNLDRHRGVRRVRMTIPSRRRVWPSRERLLIHGSVRGMLVPYNSVQFSMETLSLPVLMRRMGWAICWFYVGTAIRSGGSL